MNLSDIIAAIGAHNWLALVLIAAVYLRTIFSEKSSFPINVPPNWRPVFFGLAGGIVTTATAMEAGQAIGPALLVGGVGLVASGVFDGILAACFGKPENAPGWAKAIVMIIDDIGGKPPTGGAGNKFAAGAGAKPSSIPPAPKLPTGTTVASSKPPNAAARMLDRVNMWAVGIVCAAVLFAVASAGCAWWKANSQTVTTDAGQIGVCVIGDIVRGVTDPAVVVADCAGATVADIVAIIDSLLADPHLNAERATQLRTLRANAVSRMSK
jgi:hypothetical protein